MEDLFKGKNITITGGTGTIGRGILTSALKNGANSIKVFSNDEFGLYELEEENYSNKKIQYIIGDVRDEDSVRNVIKKTDLVFHAAALKHVDRCELNPFEAITVNINGTRNVVKFSSSEGVKKVILISTDKAVNPIGVMGATKLLAEKLITSEAISRRSTTIFTCVRLGNVIQSRGSIIPRIESQIQRGGPITLTDKKMKRFFTTVDNAIKLITRATKIANGGEIFVPKMNLINLDDLFEVAKEKIAPKYGFKPTNIKTKVIGMRPGEKLIEYLLNEYEMNHAIETSEFFIIPPLQYVGKKVSYPHSHKVTNVKRYFSDLIPISRKEIHKMLD